MTDAEPPSVPSFLVGGDEMSTLMRSHNWSASPLGAPETWAQSLKSVVGLILGSKFPMFVAWGHELGFLYNDAYAEILGAKHPAALGARFYDVWSEIWSDISPLIDAAIAGEATYREDLPLVMNRRGIPEQTWFTFSYSPVQDESGRVAGMYCACTETTAKVLAERRQAFRLRLEERLRNLAEPADVTGAAAEMLGRELGVARVGYGEVDLEQAHVLVERDWTDGRVGSVAGRHIMDDFGSPTIVELKAGRVMSIDDVMADRRIGSSAAAFAAIETRAVLAVPLVKAGRLVAMLYIHHPESRRWTEDDASLAAEVAERTWAAVERARAEAASKASEDRFRQFGEAAEDALWIVDAATGELEYLSPAFERIWGEPRERVVNDIQRWAEFLHPEDRETARAGMPQLLAGERVKSEYRIVRSDGEVRWILDVGFPIRNESGDVVRVGGIARDVTERRVAENALRTSEWRFRELNETLERRVAERTRELAESQRRFQAIFDSALQFMALLTPDGTIVELNRTALAWSQITPTDIIGRPFWLAAPMRDNPELQAAIEASVRRAAAGEVVREEYEMRGAGERRTSIDFSLKPVLGDGGAPIWLLAEGRDMTELKMAQEALRQAQKMEAIGQLTGGVAHDFNNLLTPIVGALDALQRRGVGGEREQRLIAGAGQSAERARTLVQRLLAFARQQPLQFIPVDVPQLLTGMGELIASTTGPQIRVIVEAAPDLPAAAGDPNQIEMALLNLAVNARDAMPEGGTLRLTASAERVDHGHRAKLHPGTYICISVADTGCGMDEATLSRAVEPFFSTKGVGRGTGLGLSMVHGLASQLGGALVIESRSGLGTNVELWVPQSQGAAETEESCAEAIRPTAVAGTVLLVDDEFLVRTSTADMLIELGYSVLEAASAEAALRIVDRGEPFDILLTDHLMPGMNGTDLARVVRSRRPNVRALLVSGYSERELVDIDLPRLTKPFREDELAASLARLAG